MIVILIIGVILNQTNLNLPAPITFLVIFFLILLVLAFILWRQPQDETITTFKVPFVPVFPLLSAFVNIYLMTSLTGATWIRFFIWFLIGILIYFTYSIRYSKENRLGPHILFPCFHESYNAMEDSEEIVRNESIF